jgi:hypothetical protein
MNKKEMKSLEKFLDGKFPQYSIHVLSDSKMEFKISGEGIAEHKEEVWAAADEWFELNGYGKADWGKPRYVSA